LRSIGHVENVEDYRIAFNLDQQLDQRTYNVPLTSEVAAVWIEGSEYLGQFQNSVLLQGKDRSVHGIRSYHACYDALSYPLFFPRGELGWHSCISKVGVTMQEVEAAERIDGPRGGVNWAFFQKSKAIKTTLTYAMVVRFISPTGN